jgi:hypothetical protein
MTRVNWPVASTLNALDAVMFVTTDPSCDFESMKRSLIQFDDGIIYFKDSEIKTAIDLWLDTKGMT